MRYWDMLLLELHAAVSRALDREGVVNVPAIAQEVHQRHSLEGVSLVEIEGYVLARAMALNAVVLFQRPIPDPDPNGFCQA